MHCKHCGRRTHEGSAVVLGVGAVLLLLAIDQLVFNGSISRKAFFWIYPAVFVIGCFFGWLRDRDANREEATSGTGMKEVQFANEEPTPGPQKPGDPPPGGGGG